MNPIFQQADAALETNGLSPRYVDRAKQLERLSKRSHRANLDACDSRNGHHDQLLIDLESEASATVKKFA